MLFYITHTHTKRKEKKETIKNIERNTFLHLPLHTHTHTHTHTFTLTHTMYNKYSCQPYYFILSYYALLADIRCRYFINTLLHYAHTHTHTHTHTQIKKETIKNILMNIFLDPPPSGLKLSTYQQRAQLPHTWGMWQHP